MGLFAKIDVALARDPRMISAGPLARLLYVQCVLYSRENLTDGVIDALVLPVVAIDVPRPRQLMRKLVDVGALVELPDVGWLIPEHVWRRYNPTRAEVDDQRRIEAERKASYRERRARDGDVPAGQHSSSRWDNGDARGTRADSQSQSQRESQRESQSQSKKAPSSSSSSESVDGARQLDDALAIVVEAREAEQRPRHPAAWRRTAAANLRTSDECTTLRDALDHGDTPLTAAALVLGSHTAAVLAADRLGQSPNGAA